MYKLKNMTIVCENSQKANEIYHDDMFHKYGHIMTCDCKEYESYEIKTLNITDTTSVLKVHPNTSAKDLIGLLKNQKIDAIVLENSVDMFNDEYLIFENLDEFMDSIIEKNQKYELTENTASRIQDYLVTSKTEEQRKKVEKIFEICNDERVLTETLKKLFVF